MIHEAQINYRRFLERHASYDPRTPAGHVKLVTDAVQVNKFGDDDATVWASFPDRSSMIIGAIEDVTYHSEAAKAGGWVKIVEQTLEGMHHLHSFNQKELVAVSICYDAVSTDLIQFRVVQTWTPEAFTCAFVTPEGWEWTWVPTPHSKTADLIKQVIFG